MPAEYTGALPFGDERGPVVRETDDPLDRRYTPHLLAAQIVAEVLADMFTAALGRPAIDATAPAIVIEPSVGQGTFADLIRRAWPAAHVVGVDLDPQARGLRPGVCHEAVCGDWEMVAEQATPRLREARLVIGNPPFSVAREHVIATRERLPSAWVAFLLPLAYLGVQEWQQLLKRDPPAWSRAVEGRPWPRNVRETALYVWQPRAVRVHIQPVTVALRIPGYTGGIARRAA